MSPTKTKSNAGVHVTPASASYLDTVEITVTGLEPGRLYDLVIRSPQGHAKTLRDIEPNEDGTYPHTFVVDSRGEHTVEVHEIFDPLTTTTFRGV